MSLGNWMAIAFGSRSVAALRDPGASNVGTNNAIRLARDVRRIWSSCYFRTSMSILLRGHQDVISNSCGELPTPCGRRHLSSYVNLNRTVSWHPPCIDVLRGE